MRRCMSRLGALSFQRSTIVSYIVFAAAWSQLRGGTESRTCWFMSKMAISLRSSVKRSNAASISEFCVLASTTRKFFCESGGCVTCYRVCQTMLQYVKSRELTPMPARSMPVTVSWSC